MEVSYFPKREFKFFCFIGGAVDDFIPEDEYIVNVIPFQDLL